MKPISPLCLPRAAYAAAFAAAGLLTLGGCGPRDNDPGPGGVTVGEARALDEAAEMLDQQKLPTDALESASDDGASEAAPAVQASAQPATQPVQSRATDASAAR